MSDYLDGLTVSLSSTQALVLRTLHRLSEGTTYLSAETVAARANLALPACESALASLDFKELVVGYPTRSGSMIWRLADRVGVAAAPGPRLRPSALSERAWACA